MVYYNSNVIYKLYTTLCIQREIVPSCNWWQRHGEGVTCVQSPSPSLREKSEGRARVCTSPLRRNRSIEEEWARKALWEFRPPFCLSAKQTTQMRRPPLYYWALPSRAE